jgi:type IV pilus modification protein PilV
MNGARGLTIVEVLVAMLVLTVGLLALAASAGYATRVAGQAKRDAEVATLARSRLEILRAGGCPAMAEGSTGAGPYALSWTVTAIQDGRARQIRLTVTSRAARGQRMDAFTETVLC